MKGKILLFLAITLTGLYVVAMFASINGLKLNHVWFSVVLLAIGVYALVYSFFYKLDSCFYYGVLCVMFAFATAFRFILATPFKLFYPIYILCFAIAHLAVFVKFRQYIHFKLFAILALEGILLITYKQNFINLWTLVAINGAFLLFVVIGVMFRLRKNLRRQ